MNAPAPAVISGTFVKIEPIATRKQVRLHIECPVEQANQVLATLGGYPDPANPVWVAVARLAVVQDDDEVLVEQAPPALPAPKGKRQFKDMPAATQAALTCQEPRFHAFLREERHADCSGEDEAAEFVRTFCEVPSRADIRNDNRAGSRWQWLVSAYHAWLALEAA